MNKYNKCLELFLAKDVAYNHWMKKPFQIGNKAVATDSHNAIFIPIELTDGVNPLQDLSENKIKSIEKALTYVESDSKKTIKVSDIVLTLAETPLTDDIDECSECLGTGKVDWTYDHFEQEFDCPYCDGDGEVRNSHNKVIDKKWLIQIEGLRFQHQYISKLVEVCNILNAETVDIFSKNETNLVFKINECELLMMHNYGTDGYTELIETP